MTRRISAATSRALGGSEWMQTVCASIGRIVPSVVTSSFRASARTIRMIFSDEAHAALRYPMLFLGLWGCIHTEGALPEAALARLIKS